jgi:predicted RNA-binding Zn ribbon-like protein
LAADRPAAARSVLRNAVRLRECLFRLVSDLLENRPPAEADLRSFRCFLAKGFSFRQLRASRGRNFFQWTDGDLCLESILWAIAKSAGELLTSADSGLIRPCDDDSCRWFFLDRSKNHTRRWCDMKVCGNRAKARKFYQKRTSP